MKTLFKFLTSKFVWLNVLISIVAIVLIIVGVSFWLDVYTRHGETIEVPNLAGLNIVEAELVLAESGLSYEVVDSVYLRSLQPGEISEQVPSAGTQVKSGRVIYLTINKMGGQMVKVPYLIGESTRKARTNLQNRGFIIDSVAYRPYEYDDYVLDVLYRGESLDSGALVPDNSRLVIVAGRIDSVSVVMPNLVGKTYEQAMRQIEYSQLSLGNISYDVRPEPGTDISLYYVISQDIAAGTAQLRGKIVSLRLSKSSSGADSEEEFF